MALLHLTFHCVLFRCVPFYYSGCTGNENNFESQEECEVVCPTTFSPLIQLPDGKQLLFMRGQSEGQLAVSVRANPAPTAIWRHNGREISKYDSQVTNKLVLEKANLTELSYSTQFWMIFLF